jgi:glyoxylase-like metal-dependent hydrolase (beta-lactamase superfamily II)
MSTRPIDRRDFLAGAAACAAGLAAFPGGVLGGVARRERVGPVDSPFEWAEVRPGVFASSNLATGGNCLAVAGGGRCLLVDTKFPGFAPRIADDVRAMTGLGPTHVLNTHHHADHTGGNMHFTGAASVIAHENGLPRVRAQFQRNLSGITGGRRLAGRVPAEHRESMLEAMNGLLARIDDFDADSWVADTPVAAPRTGLGLGNAGWAEIRHFGRPSHTDNDLALHLPGANLIHTGDLVFSGLHPFFDANGGCSSAGWLETLTDLDDLCDDETVIVPGHGPAGGRAIIRDQIRYIERLRESVKRGMDEGVALETLRTRTFPFMEGLGLENLRENAIVFVHNELTGG